MNKNTENRVIDKAEYVSQVLEEAVQRVTAMNYNNGFIGTGYLHKVEEKVRNAPNGFVLYRNFEEDVENVASAMKSHLINKNSERCEIVPDFESVAEQDENEYRKEVRTQTNPYFC